jgi:hypothetical protein
MTCPLDSKAIRWSSRRPSSSSVLRPNWKAISDQQRASEVEASPGAAGSPVGLVVVDPPVGLVGGDPPVGLVAADPPVALVAADPPVDLVAVDSRVDLVAADSPVGLAAGPWHYA